jgi:hypothetical protein
MDRCEPPLNSAREMERAIEAGDDVAAEGTAENLANTTGQNQARAGFCAVCLQYVLRVEN